MQQQPKKKRKVTKTRVESVTSQQATAFHTDAHILVPLRLGKRTETEVYRSTIGNYAICLCSVFLSIKI